MNTKTNSSAADIIQERAKEAGTTMRNYIRCESQSDPNFFRWFFQDNNLEDFENPNEGALRKWMNEYCESIQDIADSANGLEVVETTSNQNGYPEHLKKAIIGFDTFKEAKDMADENGMSIQFFYKQSGWNLWYRPGDEADEAIQTEVEHFGDTYCDNFALWGKDNLTDLIDDFKCNIEDKDTLEEIEAEFNQCKEIYNRIIDMADDEYVLTQHMEYQSTVKKESMQTYHDGVYTAIGLIFED